MTKLPKWILEIKNFRQQDAAIEGLIDALSISWDSLNEITTYSNDPILLSSTKDAIRRIEEMGK